MFFTFFFFLYYSLGWILGVELVNQRVWMDLQLLICVKANIFRTTGRGCGVLTIEQNCDLHVKPHHISLDSATNDANHIMSAWQGPMATWDLGWSLPFLQVFCSWARVTITEEPVRALELMVSWRGCLNSTKPQKPSGSKRLAVCQRGCLGFLWVWMGFSRLFMTWSLPTNLSFIATASQCITSAMPRLDSVLAGDDASVASRCLALVQAASSLSAFRNPATPLRLCTGSTSSRLALPSLLFLYHELLQAPLVPLPRTWHIIVSFLVKFDIFTSWR